MQTSRSLQAILSNLIREYYLKKPRYGNLWREPHPETCMPLDLASRITPGRNNHSSLDIIAKPFSGPILPKAFLHALISPHYKPTASSKYVNI